MHVDTKPFVIGKVPAGVVRIFIDHDVVSIPVPAIAVRQVVRRNAEVETAKPEARWSPSMKMPDVAGSETPGKVAVLPGVIEVVMRVIWPGIMADPVPLIDMRCVGVSRLVLKIAMRCSIRRSVERFRPTFRRRRMSTFRPLCQRRQRHESQSNQKPNRIL